MTDSELDDLMATCPLKQQLRDSLWENYSRRIYSDRPLRYLTLYSPPMMDIKHLYRRRLLELADEHFPGVVAVSNKPLHEEHALRSSLARPRLLIPGEISQLLTGKSRKCKDLQGAFPFDVINLDYTTFLFERDNTVQISDHLRAVHEIVRRQRINGATDYALFVTTRSEHSDDPTHSQFSPVFVQDLERRVSDCTSSTEMGQIGV